MCTGVSVHSARVDVSTGNSLSTPTPPSIRIARLLWSPCVIGQTIIHYFHPVVSSFFLSSPFFFSSPNLSRRRLDVYHTNSGVILDTPDSGPCSRAPVHNTREHGPSTRPVKTGSVDERFYSLSQGRCKYWQQPFYFPPVGLGSHVCYFCFNDNV